MGSGGGRRAEIYRGLQQLLRKHEGVIRTGFPAIRRRVSGYNLPGLLPENGFDVGRAAAVNSYVRSVLRDMPDTRVDLAGPPTEEFEPVFD